MATTLFSPPRARLDRVVEAPPYALGLEVVAFERAAAAHCDCAHVVAVSTGSDAVRLGLTALGVGPGDDVVTTPYSFFETGSAIVRLGARPVYVDIDPVTFNIDARRVEAALTPRTKAILPVHLFGQMADMAPLVEVSRESGVPVLEDAAQSIGAVWHGRAAGSLGRLGCFSFFPSKTLGGFGLVATDDAALAAKLRALRNEAALLDGRKAALLRAKLHHLEVWTTRRQSNAATYRRLFAEAGLVGTVRLPAVLPRLRHVYSQFVVRCDRRDALGAHLRDHGIGWDGYEPAPTYLQECLATMVDTPEDFPEAERAARESLALPIHPDLTEGMQAAVVEAIAEFFS